jgi:hypothetical protein
MTSAISAAERDSNSIIEGQLDSRAETLEIAANADMLCYIGPMYPPADDQIKDAVEAIPKRRRSLMVILETAGLSDAAQARHIRDPH